VFTHKTSRAGAAVRLCLPALLIVAVVCGPYAAGADQSAYERARYLLGRGVLIEAVRELESHVREHPRDESAHLLLARTLIEIKRSRQAASHAMAVLRLNPDHEEARRMLTEIRLRLGRELDRSDPEAVLDYARLSAQPETYDRAERYYRLYFELTDQPAVRREFAEMLSWAGRYEFAAQEFEHYLSEVPGDLDAWQKLGRVYNSLSRFDDAAETFRLCLARRPDDTELQLDLARALTWSGREQEARALLRAVHRRAPRYEEPLLQLAFIARISGELDDAHALYSQILAVNPENAEALHWVAELERGPDLAINRLEKRLLSEPDDRAARMELVTLYIADGRLGAAVRELDEAVARDQQDTEARERLDALRQREGEEVAGRLAQLGVYRDPDVSRRIEVCRAWLERHPDDHRTRLRLAELLAAKGDRKAAVEALEAVAMAGDNRLIEETLTRLRLAVERDTADNRQHPR